MIQKETTTRGMSTPLSHVLSVGITTILIVGLVSGAAGLLDTHAERTARGELDTIGNRLASELDRADTLGQGGDNVTLTSTYPQSIAGSTYTAQLRHDAASCSGVPTDTCLVLSATEYEYDSVIPVDNETNVSLRETTMGTFQISSEGGTARPQAPTRSLDLSARVGIGGDVGAGPPPGVGTSLEQKPIARFTFFPGQPINGTGIDFDASQSSDPDGSIEYYEWDFDADGNYERNVSTPVEKDVKLPPGWQNVTLKVKDDSGSTSTYSRDIRVGGIVFSKMKNVSNTKDSMMFEIKNEYESAIDIDRVLIDPDDNTINWLEDTSDNEISISNADEISIQVDRAIELHNDGAIVNFHESGEDIKLESGKSATVYIRNFYHYGYYSYEPDIVGKRFTIGIRYQVNGSFDGSVTTDTVIETP